jgi:hypothetical protein
MNKDDISSQLNAKYNEIYPQYWEVLMKRKEEPNNQELCKIYDYLHSNLKYLEKYLSLIEIEDKELMMKALERNNFIKELTDILYEPRESKPVISNPKIEEVNCDTLHDSRIDKQLDTQLDDAFNHMNININVN